MRIAEGTYCKIIERVVKQYSPAVQENRLGGRRQQYRRPMNVKLRCGLPMEFFRSILKRI